jgi:hypothetical protein
MSDSVTLRRIRPEDEAFLYQVYAGTRTAEMAAVDWSTEQKEAFLRMQFAAQHRYYLAQYPQAAFDVILLADRPVGRFYVDRRPNDILVVDIALLPRCRTGIGAALLRGLNAEADRLGKPILGTVERYNRALLLFRRLGFVATADHGMFLSVERRPHRYG